MVEWFTMQACHASWYGFESRYLRQNLKFVIMFKKNRYEDEERGLPEFVKVIIALAIVGGMLVFAWKIGEWSTEKDMEFQYQDQMVKVD